MSEQIFGLDFGTTNSLAALVVGNECRSLKSEIDDRPHPSVVWYRGSEVIVGREARRHLDNLDTTGLSGFVRSPKMALRREGPIYADGRPHDPIDVVSAVLGHIKEDARLRRQKFDLSRAVMTIPVDFGGEQRRALRAAAAKAGITIFQFVHEPVAALYGYLRSQAGFRQKVAALENSAILVFDWGGGTLDLTLCRVIGGTLMQISSHGNNEIGGDRFDEKILTLIRDRHAARYHLENLSIREQPGTRAALLAQCELAKIELSSRDSHIVILKDFLKGDGPERNVDVTLTRADLDDVASKLVATGFDAIDKILANAGLERRDIELCLATGGMVNMPAIRNGLTERFGHRLSAGPNGDTSIAEGAAWIAHDRLRLTLAKPLEIAIADRNGSSAHLALLEAGRELPVEHKSIAANFQKFYCLDPRDGRAVFSFAKPQKVGLIQSLDARSPLCVVSLPIDHTAKPFFERLHCELRIDQDYIAHVTLRSTGTGNLVRQEFHDLDFGLRLPDTGRVAGPAGNQEPNDSSPSVVSGGIQDGSVLRSAISSNIVLRPNVTSEISWDLVPGDVVRHLRPELLSKLSGTATPRQIDEEMYYRPCALCGREVFKIGTEGRTAECDKNNCPLPHTSMGA